MNCYGCGARASDEGPTQSSYRAAWRDSDTYRLTYKLIQESVRLGERWHDRYWQ